MVLLAVNQISIKRKITKFYMKSWCVMEWSSLLHFLNEGVGCCILEMKNK